MPRLSLAASLASAMKRGQPASTEAPVLLALEITNRVCTSPPEDGRIRAGTSVRRRATSRRSVLESCPLPAPGRESHVDRP